MKALSLLSEAGLIRPRSIILFAIVTSCPPSTFIPLLPVKDALLWNIVLLVISKFEMLKTVIAVALLACKSVILLPLITQSVVGCEAPQYSMVRPPVLEYM